MAWMSDEKYQYISDCREKKSIAASAFKQRTHCGKGGSVKFPSDFMSRKELKAMNGEVKSYRMNDPISWEEFLEWPNEYKVAYIKKLRERFGVNDLYIANMFDVACNTMLAYFREFGLDIKAACDDDFEREKFLAWRTGANTELVQENDTADETKEIDLTAPMTWAEFKNLPDDDKIQYIKWIRETFGATDGNIADMLGICRSNFSKCTIKRLGLGVGKGKNCSKWDVEGFQAWMGGKESSAVVEEESAVDEAIEKDITESVVEPIPDPGPIAFTGHHMPVIPKSGSMTFECNNADDALATIKCLLGNVKVNLTISWECVFPEEGVYSE